MGFAIYSREYSISKYARLVVGEALDPIAERARPKSKEATRPFWQATGSGLRFNYGEPLGSETKAWAEKVRKTESDRTVFPAIPVDEKGLSKQLRFIPLSSLRSINACLVALGATRPEVYSTRELSGINIKPPLHDHLKGGGQFRHIYQRYSGDELWEWAKSLYREAAIKYHPDKHPEKPKFYGRKMAQANQAFQRIKRILDYRGVEVNA